jgi:hypothetical protein
MKKITFWILFWGIFQPILNYNESQTKTCPSCINSLQEARSYIEQLEKRIKVLHDDIARWMKLYAEEISSKTTFLERHMTNLIDLTAKYINLEQKTIKNK